MVESEGETRRGSTNDPHAAFRIGERAWGVQFHPEWDHDVMRFYLEARLEVEAHHVVVPLGMELNAPSPLSDAEGGVRVVRRSPSCFPFTLNHLGSRRVMGCALASS